jgi:hypothetical protein
MGIFTERIIIVSSVKWTHMSFMVRRGIEDPAIGPDMWIIGKTDEIRGYSLFRIFFTGGLIISVNCRDETDL